MKFLEESSPLGANHPAVKQYNKCMRGAGDTVRSIIISANSRLAFLENKQVLRLLSKDELNLADIGIGVNSARVIGLSDLLRIHSKLATLTLMTILRMN